MRETKPRSKAFIRLIFGRLCFAVFLVVATEATAQPEPLKFSVATLHGPQKPSAVPFLPGLQLDRNPFGGLVGIPAEGQGYQPVDGDSFLCRNGKQAFNYTITQGAWWLLAGESPQVMMTLRTAAGAYARPGILPDLAVSGRLRVAVAVGAKSKWLDKFDSIEAVLAPGSARWTCSDQSLDVTVKLEVLPFISVFGYAATATVSAGEAKDVTLTWAFGNVGGDNDVVDLKEQYAVISSPKLKYTRAFAGCEGTSARAAQGDLTAMMKSNDPSQLTADSKSRCALLSEQLRATPEAARSRFLCLSGYSDYNHKSIAEAYDRLEFRPFADPRWVEDMKRKWFEHWIGRGLEPEKKYLDLRGHAAGAIAESVEFWQQQRRRLSIKTPDERFDTVVNSHAAMARELYEYPGFLHGLGYAKYGKINHGYYGFEAAGMHDEVENSLKFVSGTQDFTGRQRYIMTTFAVSDWHEDMDFYFTEQVWYHWRWTGDKEFARVMWPSVKRALEHGIRVSDPDGDGIMTGFYEMWNSDQNNPGGYSALQTAMGWAALRAGAQLASLFNEQDASYVQSSQPDRPSFQERYSQMRDLVEKQYGEHLWQKDVGAWAATEPTGFNRPHPHTCEQNYAIWRGIGDPMRNYMAMRFIRENYHYQRPLPGSTLEYINDWWPIIWSHHYPASGDTCASFHSACVTGQTDEFWPAFRSVYETAYLNGGAIWHHTGSRSMEMEPLFLQAVVDGLFGVKPWFGENLLVIRPNLPAKWDRADFDHVDVSYKFRQRPDGLTLEVATPVARQLRVELPVQAAIQSVQVNGQTAEYKTEAGINSCRVVVATPAARSWQIEVRTSGDAPKASGALRVFPGRQAKYVVENAKVAQIHDPQGKTSNATITETGKGTTEVTFIPSQTGKFTVFLELQAGNATWFRPLDIESVAPWSIVESYIPPLTKGGPVQTSPAVDTTNKTMALEIRNNGDTELAAPARITIGGIAREENIRIAAGQTRKIIMSLAEVWQRLSPGAVPVRVELAGRSETCEAVNWEIGKSSGPSTSRLRPLDLTPHYNADMPKLFSSQTQWRVDYTGAQHGVDRRWPLPLRDEKGYVLMATIMGLYDYGTIPEISPIDRTRWEMPSLKADFDTGAGISFKTQPNRILALCCTEPYAQFPSAATLQLDPPRRLEKLYLLTANLIKTLKCYYPGGELVVQYADGSRETHLMIPPYTMPGSVGNTCPKALAIRFGNIVGAPPTADKTGYLSVLDTVLDGSKPVTSIEIRCVATETLVGIVGATVLEAP